MNKALYIAALFFLARLSQAEVILSDSFDYTNGPLITVSDGKWRHHNGATTGQVNVASERVFLTDDETEDVNAELLGQPFTPASGNVLYASFTVNFTNLPSLSGEYFAHFRAEEQGNAHYCRIFALKDAAPPGFFRLGIANFLGVLNSASAVNDMNLTTNTDYTVVIRYVVSNAVSTLWVSSTSEFGTGATATDLALPVDITDFAFRQSDGIGNLFVDNLLVTNDAPIIAPTITNQPQNQIVNEGGTITFTVGVSGTPPFSYQWQFNGIILPGETNATLSLTNVTSTQEGTYQVVVSNAGGSTNSDDATLSVIPAFVTGPLTLLTYNVHGNGIDDWSTNSSQVQAIGRQVAYLHPDIITFNEIPYTNTYQMADFVNVYLPQYFLATNSGTDGHIRSVIASRFIITRSQKWLDGVSLAQFGYTNGNFTRDLFEAQVSVPNFSQPLHVFVAHLKATSFIDPDDDAAKRAAEASAISNFFVNGFLLTNANHLYVLAGDMNEDINRPDPDYVSGQPIQRLANDATGLRLTTPVNPFNNDDRTISIQNRLTARFDYILPCGLLFSNIVASQVFRTDLLNPTPPSILAEDDRTASDHLPVLMAFNNPYAPPFRITFVNVMNETVSIHLETAIGGVYGVQASADLTNWSDVANNLVALSTNITFSTNVQGGLQFFRAYRLPLP